MSQGLAVYLYNVGVCVSQFINCVILLGDPDVSISGRLGYAYYKKSPKWFVGPWLEAVDFIFLYLADEKNHCLNSIELEELNGRELWRWYN